MDTISIIIPAHNEADRIGKTVRTYYTYFSALQQQQVVDFQLLVVLNGCTDNTYHVVQDLKEDLGQHINLLDIAQAGKGLAIIEGFSHAVQQKNEYIGFVDADMATQPQYFFDLYEQMGSSDGAIASRYTKGAFVDPPRPWIKTWGRKIFYNSLVRLLFGLTFADYQCGAKLFKRRVIEQIIDDMQEGQWAFDVELLYLAHKRGFEIKEIPTVWHDQAGSKLDIMGSGTRMLSALFKLKRAQRNK